MTSDKEVGQPPAQGPADQMTPDSSSLSGQPSASELLTALGFRADEHVGLCYKEPAGEFTAVITTVEKADAAYAAMPAKSCRYFPVNPTTKPVGAPGRGSANEVSRLNLIPFEIDYDKPGQHVTDEQVDAVIADLSEVLGVPTLTVNSGHGVHIEYQVIGGEFTDEFSRDDACALLLQCRQLFEAICARHGIEKTDNVTKDIARVMRMPGTFNHKPENPAPIPVTIRSGPVPWGYVMARKLRETLPEVLASVTPPPSQKPPQPPRRHVMTVVTDASADHPYITTSVERELTGLATCPKSGGKHDGRSNHLLRVAGNLSTWRQLDREQLREQLTAAAVANGWADEPGSDVDGTITRGFDYADTHYEPRTVPASDREPLGCTDFGPAPLAVTTAPVGGDDGDDGDEPIYTDFAALLSGGLPEPPAPTVLTRTDDVSIFYGGKRNEVYGDPEGGKTMLALAAMAEELNNGGRVLFIDLDNNGPIETAERMLMLGARRELLVDPDRFRHCQPDDGRGLMHVVADAVEWAATLAVTDCVGELIPLMGGGSNDSDDYTRIMRAVSTPLEKVGAAVVLIDHPAKGTDSRAYGAGGTMAKRRAVMGASIEVRCVRQFIRGQGGKSELWINKDRPGGLRQHCEKPADGQRRQCAGTFTLDPPDADTGIAEWDIDPGRSPVASVSIDPKLERFHRSAIALQSEGCRLTAPAIAARALGMPDGTSLTDQQRKDADRMIAKLVKEGRLEHIGTDGRTRIWQVPEDGASHAD